LNATGKTLGSKIRSQPIAAFFALAFTISWAGWYAAPLIGGNDLSVVSLINIIAGFGPAFSALIVSAAMSLEPSGASPKKRIVTFAVTSEAAFVLLTLYSAFVKHDLTSETIFVWLAISIAAGYVISCVYHRRREVAQTMSGLKMVSGRNGWVWLGLLLPFAFQAVGGAVDFALGGKEVVSLTASTFVSLVAYYPYIFFFGGALNEEPGWRGFATPRFLKRYSPLAAGLVIGVVWTLWHFPLSVTIFNGNDFLGFLFRFVYNVPFGVLFTWLYYRSRGNLFACMLLHASVNSADSLFGPTSSLVAIPMMIAFTITAILYNKMYRNFPSPFEGQK
jgi:uncharacterized protein